ncbi:MAG: SDR family oxidoreductase [Leptospira sp.]|nr:SDR family oxidoreductase [Leptospira sp.]
MKTGIITGASSGIGLSIARKLISKGYKIYGIARSFENTNYSDKNFIRIVCDVSDIPNVTKGIKEILSSGDQISLLINNAGVGYFGPHEDSKIESLEEMVKTNLLAPVIITKLLLKELKKNSGYLIFISSITALRPSPVGAAYSATKAGLTKFSESLFDEVRKTGVKVITIHPDMTKSNFYDELDFKEDDDPECHIAPESISDAVEMILNQKPGTVISEITIRPQKHRIEKKKRSKN